jgi:hypothetical protein
MFIIYVILLYTVLVYTNYACITWLVYKRRAKLANSLLFCSILVLYLSTVLISLEEVQLLIIDDK